MSGRDIYRITFKNWVEWSEDDLFGLFAGHGRSCYMGEQASETMFRMPTDESHLHPALKSIEEEGMELMDPFLANHLDELMNFAQSDARVEPLPDQVADPMAQPQSVPEPEFIASSVPTDEPTEAAPNVSEGKRALVVVTHQADDLYNVFYM